LIKSILVTLDGSSLAEAVLPYIAAIARRLDSQVTLFHAIDPSGLDVPVDMEDFATSLPSIRSSS
jgi:nucleotide-binding universal stress UspA family protein